MGQMDEQRCKFQRKAAVIPLKMRLKVAAMKEWEIFHWGKWSGTEL